EYNGPDTGNEWMRVSYEVLKSDPSVITSVAGGDNGPEDSFRVSVYPNPAMHGGNINVMVETILPQPVRVQLLDLTGRSLFEAVYQPGEILHGVPVNARGTLHAGLYLVAVEQGGITVREKVVIK